MGDFEELGSIFSRTDHGKKKAPEPLSSGRLGSPPPELPNHEGDTKAGRSGCKRHFSNEILAAGNPEF